VRSCRYRNRRGTTTSPRSAFAAALFCVAILGSGVAAQDPFAIPEIRVSDLKKQSATDPRTRVKVIGVVTRQRMRTSLHVRTEDGSVRAETDLPLPVVPGDRVEVVGTPVHDAYSPFLADAVFRRIGAGAAPSPLAANLVDLLGGNHDAELVTVEASFVSGQTVRDEYAFEMQDEGTTFEGRLLLPSVGGVPTRLTPGARLRLTGICSVETSGGTRTFRLLLRDAADIVDVIPAAPLSPPPVQAPWWIWLVGAVAAGATGLAGWASWRMQSQEQTIRRQLAREASLKARFDDLFERSSEILVIHDRRGRVSTLNRAGEQATGYSREEVRMLDPTWIFGQDYLDAIMQLLEEGADSPGRSFKSELVPRKGARIPVDVHTQLLIGDGQVVGVTSIARDLSERDRLETELRQAQKMEAVGRLATGIAHDFNNLITVLLGYSDELIENVPEGSEWQTAALEIRRAAERASGLTQQLLSFSRRQTAVPKVVELNLMVSNMEDLVRRLIGPEIRLDVQLAPDLGPIYADATQIGQVLMNLVVNARDAMPNGGVLRIETANVEFGADNIDVIPGPHVMIAVRDTGVGMSPDVRKRLFEPFFTTKEMGQGTGLGLSMVQAIVRQSGGHVTIESAPGEGSTFRVYFPRSSNQVVPAPAQIPPPGSSLVKGEGVILLAEDDMSVRRLVTTELVRRGFTVLDAEDGRAALELLKQHVDRVDVLVTDVVMPRMNGADLAKAAEKVRPGLKILFISGHPERAGQGLDPTGATNLLMKPFTADVLASRIKNLIQGIKSDADTWGN
jgi:two-component system, cell cycle sensor histidine kinase and response regulator CckA